MDRKTSKKIAKALGLGATGRFPHGKLRPVDAGELKSVVLEEGDMVVIVFGKPVSWVSMTPDDALNMADVLTKRAMRIMKGTGTYEQVNDATKEKEV